MLKPEYDLLYLCLDNHLNNYHDENESEEHLINRVIEDFAARLVQRGHIPTQYLDELHRELEEDLLEMLRKKIYGHWDLAHYRRVNTRRTA